MTRTSLPRCAVVLTVVVAFALFSSLEAQEPPSALKPYVQTSREMSLERTQSFLDTAVYHPAAQRSSATLTAQFAENTLNGLRLRHRSYNGALVGPTLRVHPGDTLEIVLENRLIESASGQPDAAPHANYNLTNLHMHGLHVSPSGESDNVFLTIAPGEIFHYRITVPKNHPPGTYWYHAHRHGSTAIQVASGMAGAIIVEGGLDQAPELKGVGEKILVFQQFVMRPQPGGKPAEVLPEDIYAPGTDVQIVTAINGQVTPEIVMRPREIQRWRMIHAGISRTVNLNLEGHRLHEIAYDGLTTGSLSARSQIELQPGNRADVLVQACDQPGTYLLKTEVTGKGAAVRGLTVPATYVAKVVVSGEPMADAKLPGSDALAKYRPAELRPIQDDEVQRRREFTLLGTESDQGGIYQINGAAFDPTVFDPVMPLGSVEQWTITSQVGGHPFHPHINPMELTVMDPETGKPERVWRDTVFVRPGETIKVRTRIADFTGRSVLHCHILDHEDKGMMRAFEIVRPGEENFVPRRVLAAPQARAIGLRGAVDPPQAVPAWALQDAYDRLVRSVEYKGRPLVLVLHRGLGCPHCEQQLLRLGRREADFLRLGITVIAVSPRPTTRETAEQYRKQQSLALPLLADPKLELFEALGCLRDGREPLHGTLILDAEGRVRWRSVGEEPEGDIEQILNAARALAVISEHR